MMQEDELCQISQPLIASLVDDFDVASAKYEEFCQQFGNSNPDEFMRSHLYRYFVKQELAKEYELAPISNTGIEVVLPLARVKVLRSTHNGGVPKAKSISRMSYCSTSMIMPADGTSADEWWGQWIEADGYAHLIVDWRIEKGEAVLHLSEPLSASKGTTKLKWRRLVSDSGDNSSFDPTDEPFNLFGDDETPRVVEVI